MARIIPIRDLRDTTKISDMCRESSEPIFVTKNGYGEMVIMNMQVYEDSVAKLEMYERIMEGKRQSDGGKLVDGEKALTQLGEKYNLV